MMQAPTSNPTVTELIRIFFAELPKNSLGLLLLSSVVGGVIGASIKLTFSTILPDRIRDARAARRLISRHRNPLIRSADALASRISNMLRNAKRDWLRQSDYYRLSTYYVVCTYFAWVELLYGHLLRLRYTTSRRNRQLNRALLAVDKTFNNTDYFGRGHYASQQPAASSSGELPKFITRALGEIVTDSSRPERPRCIGFADFCKRHREDAEFREWLRNLDPFFGNLKNEYGNTTWDRLHLIQLSLISLTNFLDAAHEQSRSYGPADTRRLLRAVGDAYARELFCADVVRYRLPVVAEDLGHRLRRRVRLAIGKSPILVRPRDARAASREELVIRVSADSRSLSTKPGRARLYDSIAEQAREKTDKFAFGVTLSVELTITGSGLADDIVARMPESISNVSGRRVAPTDVSIMRVPLTAVDSQQSQTAASSAPSV